MFFNIANTKLDVNVDLSEQVTPITTFFVHFQTYLMHARFDHVDGKDDLPAPPFANFLRKQNTRPILTNAVGPYTNNVYYNIRCICCIFLYAISRIYNIRCIFVKKNKS